MKNFLTLLIASIVVIFWVQALDFNPDVMNGIFLLAILYTLWDMNHE